MRKIQRLDEFLANNPTTKPTTKPSTPTTRPTRQAPSPIRRDKPSTSPKPMATAEDVVNYFIETLRAEDGEIKFDLKKLKKRYESSK
jgi:hypothetical protein